VQVNSLGLSERQPENNVYRILIEMLGVVLSKTARARAVQLPAWNEALGLPRPWDQQWSLRMQQIVAFETDLLDYGDIFEGSSEIARKTEELKQSAQAELKCVLDIGGAVSAVEQGYMKRRLVQSNGQRIKAIESGEQVVIGVNAHTESEPSPLSSDGAFVSVRDDIQYERCQKLKIWRSKRDDKAAITALQKLRSAAVEGKNIMEASIGCAKASVTTGEWADVLRDVFGEYRAPTGVELIGAAHTAELAALRRAVKEINDKLGTSLRLLIGKPGLDGHSNGAEQIAERAARCGIDVRYDGIRFTPEQIAQSAREARVHIIGLSILSGSHVPLIREVMKNLRDLGLDRVPVVVGGIIPPEDVHILKQLGVSRVYGPKDFEINRIIGDMIEIVDAQIGPPAANRKIPEFGEG
jgi:(2R)-ethylmalonyl-CoA mutase